MTTAFISYSHRDEQFRTELETHLAPLRRQGLVSIWHDRRIIPGDHLDDTISAHLEAADLILMLISADFVASDYCYGKEMARTLERHEARQTRAISIICRPCDFARLPFARFLLLPTDAKPVSTWTDRDTAWLDVVRGIRMALAPAHRPPTAPPVASQPASARPSRPAFAAFGLTKTFTDLDKHDFLEAAFEQIFAVFKANGAALEEANPGVTVRVTRIDAQAFALRIFVQGKEVGGGSVFQADGSFGRNQICFNFDPAAPRNSMNEWFGIETHEGTLALKSSGMLHMMAGDKDRAVSLDEAAGMLWNAVLDQAKARMK
jgi:hypothetical protein